MVECWKRNKYVFSDLEEMFLVNMQQNQDKELLARELGSTLGDDRESLPEGVSCEKLVNLTIEFFTTEPSMEDKLCKYRENISHAEKAKRIVIGPGMKRERSPTLNLDVEIRPKKKMSKFDSLKPISNYLESLLVSHGLTQHRADLVVLDIAERFVTAGFGWDKVLQYHAKGIEIFTKKLIPHVFMSKDDFPPTITSDMVLNKTFEFMEDWKNKLYDMLSFNTINLMQSKKTAVTIKQEPVDQLPNEFFTQGHQNVDYSIQQSPMEIKREKQQSNLLWKPSLVVEHTQDPKKEEYFQDNEGNISKLSRKKYKKLDERHSSPLKTQVKRKYPKSSQSQTQPARIKTRSRSISPESQRFNTKLRDYENNFKKYESVKTEKRDIDARYEPVPSSYFSKHGMTDNDGFLTLDDGDGKTTFYHYKEKERQSIKEKEMERSSKKKMISSKESCKDLDHNGSVNNKKVDHDDQNKTGHQPSSDDTKEEILREALRKRLANKTPTDEQVLKDENEKKETRSENSKEKEQDEKKISLLDKVNKIIKSCVMLKEEKKTNVKDSRKAEVKLDNEEKDKKQISDSEIIGIKGHLSVTINKVNEAKLEDGELNDSEQEDESEQTVPNKSQRKVTIFNKNTAIEEGYDYNFRRSSSAKSDGIRASSKSSRTSSSLKTRSQTKSKTRSKSRSRSQQRGRKRQGSFSNTLSRKIDSIPRKKSWSRQRSLSQQYRRSRSRSSPRYTEYRRRQSRSPDRMRRSEQWVPVSPCTIQENVTLEKCSTMMVTVAPRSQFSFKGNKGSMVRITKWTGRDYIGCIHIKPQIVTIDENQDLQIEVENPYPEKNIYLQKHDSIACLSILTSPIPSAMFSSVHSSPADKYENGSKRWFKVTSVVLHKKGMQFILLGYHGCYHHCFYHNALLLHS